ncbi:Hpt domain-containing protein [uncultured Endozoicomonas sp.]|uniref:Hpt domain-containing protein n=1 Tax=uncultured Endozoicomonas sp. TaxID=432652 RepID=UPI00261F9C60|nr:Hpt domain-containing protein [uncultured Endozoicomonas sp.]
MVEQREYLGLDWVISEIDTTLTEARQDLETYAEAMEDQSSLAGCRAKIQQVHSTLKVLKQQSARLLTSEILLLLENLQESSAESKPAGQKSDENSQDKMVTLIQAMLQLPDYLVQISRTGRDNPRLFQKLLSDMRQLRGESALSDLDFFSPTIVIANEPIADEQLAKIQAGGFTPLVRKMRQKYQLSLAGVLRGSQQEQQLVIIGKIFAKMQNLCWDSPLSPLWDAATGLAEGLREGAIAADNHAISILRKMDNELKLLTGDDIRRINTTPDEELLRHILYRVGKAESNNALLLSLKHRYGLDKALEQNQADEKLTNFQATAPVVSAIKEELANVKDALDLYILNPETNRERLQEHMPVCQQITDTLRMLGLDKLQSTMQKESESLHLILTTEQPNPAEINNSLIDIAARLLEVETGLNQFMSYRPTVTGDGSESSQMSDIHQTVIHEARETLEQAKGTLVDYLGSNENKEFLTKLIPMLKSIQGSLAIIPLPRVADLMGRCSNYIKNQWLEITAKPELDELEALADALSSVEYYLEQLTTGVSNFTEKTLDITQQSIEKLEARTPAPSIPENKPAPTTKPVGEKVNPFASHLLSDEEKKEQQAAQPTDTNDHVLEFNYEKPVTKEQVQVVESSQSDDGYNLSIDFSPTISSATPEPEKVEAQNTVDDANLSIDFKLDSAKAETAEQTLEETKENDEALFTDFASDDLTFEIETSESAQNSPEPILDDQILSLDDMEFDESEFEADPIGPEIEASLALSDNVLDFTLDDEEDLGEIFVEEATEVQELLTEQYAIWRKDRDDVRSRTEVRRAFHTLKGSGRMIGAEVIGELGWSIESMLNQLIDGKINISDGMIQLIDDVIVMLPELVQDFASQNQQLTPEVLVCMEKADALAKGLSFVVEQEEPESDAQDDPAVLFGEVVPAVEGISIAEEIQPGSNEGTNEESDEEYDQQLLEIFDNEARSHLAVVKDFIERFYQLGDSIQISDTVQRALHTLKGSAYMADITPLADLIAAIERTVKEFRAHLVPADSQIISMLEQGIDLIEDALVQLHGGAKPVELKVDNYLNWIAALHSQLLSNSLQDDSSHDAPATIVTQQGQQASLFLSNDLDLLLDANTFLKGWVNGIPKEELERFKFELRVLTANATEASLATMAELCDVLLDVCTYLETRESSLPELLLMPFMDGFEALVEMMNQVASQQTPESPQAVFADLRKALALLLNEQQALQSIEASPAPVEPVIPDIVIEELDDSAVEEIVITAPANNKPTEITPKPSPATPATATAQLDEYELELRQNFIEEAFELLEDSAQALEVWLDAPDDLHPVHELQRSLHTLKGGARMAELYELGDLCHALEDIYEVITTGRCTSDRAPLALIQKTHDTIESSLKNLSTGMALPSTANMLEELQSWKQRLISGDTAPEVEVLPDYLASPESVQSLASAITPAQFAEVAERAEITPVQISTETANPLEPVSTIKVATQNTPASEGVALQTAPSEMIRVPSDLLETLINLAGESSISRSRIEQQTADTARTLDEMNRTILRVREQLKRLDIETQTQIMSRHQGDLGENPDFDPLEMDQYSELSQLSHALVESASDLVDLREAMQEKTKDMEGLLAQQSRTQIELQEKLMKARMVSFSRLVPRLRKIVRQVSDELGKPVELMVGNAEGEMDRTMLERVLAPLEHMLRNAIGHGIENAIEDRQRLGKPDIGQISISIRRDGSDVVIELSDDGRGIDVEAVKAKAIEQGLISKSAQLSDQEALELIMRSGFSTASSITHISGRGVGLDVVNSSVRQLGGSIQVKSETGEGTHFSLRLPFTLSINRALMVEVGGSLYALPMHAIDGISMMSSDILTDCYHNNSPLVYGNGTEHKLIYMGALLGTSIPKISEGQCPVVLVQRGNDNVAVHVDAIIGSREIITKSLGLQFSGLAGVNGATILGDGRVVVILDPAALYRRRLLSHIKATIKDEAEKSEKVAKVLIVDDSVTVRKVTSRLLTRQGYEVSSARDGVEALAMLAEQKPDIMLLDIEMPRMDGFEVASSVRNDPELNDLPIIMITSRTGEKHRTRAMSLGVNEYIGKPFQEGPLLKAIKTLIMTETA